MNGTTESTVVHILGKLNSENEKIQCEANGNPLPTLTWELPLAVMIMQSPK